MKKSNVSKRFLAVLCAILLLGGALSVGWASVVTAAPAEDLVLDLAGLGAGNNVTAKTYDKETNTVTIDYSGQLWLYWTLWSTDRWSTDQSALDISPYKYVTVDIEMKTGNPFAVAAKPVFNLCNEGGKAISNPWTGGATVDTAALKEMKVGTRKTVSLPLNTESLKSIFYGIIMCDNCGAGQIVIRDLRLTADDRTVTAPAEDLVLDLAGLGAGNNVTAKTYDKETNTVTIDYSGQLWLYWTLWSTDRWSTDQSALDISPYKYVTVDIEMKTGNPFAVAAKPVFNLCNEGGKAISNPWTGGATVDTAALKEMKVGTRKTVSLPLNTESLKSIFYGIIMCDNCGAGQIVIRDLRLTADDRSSDPTPTPEPGDDEDGDFVLDLSAVGSGNGKSGGKYAYDADSHTLTVDFSGQLWAYWMLWKTNRWNKTQAAVNIEKYNYVTLRVKVEGTNPFARAAAPTFNLCNDGGQAINNPWTGIGVNFARLEAVTAADDFVTLSLPLKTSELLDFYYIIMLCDSCGSGKLTFTDLRLTEDDRTDEAFRDIGQEEENPKGDLILDTSAWGSGYDSTTASYNRRTGILTAEYSGMLWMYWQGWNAAGYQNAAYAVKDYRYLTLTVRMDENNPFAVAAEPRLKLCNDGGVAISAPDKGRGVDPALLRRLAKPGEWVTLSLPLTDGSLTDFYYLFMLCESCGTGRLEISDTRLTADDRTGIYTGPAWDPAKGIWLDVTGWSNQYPQGASGEKHVADDTLDISTTGQIMYVWTAWSSVQTGEVIDFADYPFLTMEVRINGSNPFKVSRNNDTAVGVYICDEGGRSINTPFDFGAALIDNLCEVRKGDGWVTVSLSLENVDQNTLRYIYIVTENCGVGSTLSIRNMCLTEADQTPEFIRKRVSDAQNADQSGTSEEESFTDPDDKTDDYSDRESGESGSKESDKSDESGKTPASDRNDPVDTGVGLPLCAVVTAGLALGAIYMLRKKTR